MEEISCALLLIEVMDIDCIGFVRHPGTFEPHLNVFSRTDNHFIRSLMFSALPSEDLYAFFFGLIADDVVSSASNMK